MFPLIQKKKSGEAGGRRMIEISLYFWSRLCNQGRGSRRFVFPGGRKLLGSFVVTGKTVDSALDKNKTEFGVLIFPVSFQMLADGNGLFNQMIHVLWNLRGKTQGFQNSNDFASRNALHLSDTVRVSEDDTDLRRSQTLFGQLRDVIGDLGFRDLQPRRRCSSIRKS